MANIPEATQRLVLHSSSGTHPGMVRQNNEDEVFADDERGIYFVVDGMGGHAAGEEAARIAKERLKGRLEWTAGSAEERVREAITLANNAIFEAAEGNPAYRGMACVLTVALVQGTTAVIGHVGDSRLYQIRGGELRKITRDHSPVGQLEDSQELSENEAMAHPRRNEVYRDVGSAPHSPDDPAFIDIYSLQLEPDSALLLCTDGLTDALTSGEIGAVVHKRAGKPDEVVQRLLDRAVRKGKDNVSLVYAEGPEFASKRKGQSAEHADPESDITAPNPVLAASTADSGTQHPSVRKWAVRLGWLAIGAVLFAVAERAPDLLQRRIVPNEPRVLRVVPGATSGPATIKSALEQANTGDTVELAPGVYEEAVVITKDVTISGQGARIQPPEDSEPMIGVSVAAGANAVFDSIQVSGNDGQSLIEGMKIDGHATLQHVSITGAMRAGIDVRGHGWAKIDYSSIHDNLGPGLLLQGNASAVVRFNSIIGNGYSETSAKPGVAIESDGRVEMLGNTFAENAAEAIWDVNLPAKQVLVSNYFSVKGRSGRPEDVRLIRDRPAL